MYREKMQKRIENAVMNSYKVLYRIAMAYVGNEEAALCIVRESVYKAVRNAGQVKNERYIGTWIYKNVMSTVMEFQRKNQSEVSFEKLFEIYEQGKEAAVQERDTKKLLASLGERERAVLILHFFEDRKLEEIAIILNANISTVESLLYRSLKKMGIEMVEEELQYEG